MVRLHSVTLDFVQHCIEKYEKDNPGDVVRIFDPMPNSNNTLFFFYKKPTTWRVGSTFLRKPRF